LKFDSKEKKRGGLLYIYSCFFSIKHSRKLGLPLDK
jgi:hypothetical protein